MGHLIGHLYRAPGTEHLCIGNLCRLCTDAGASLIKPSTGPEKISKLQFKGAAVAWASVGGWMGGKMTGWVAE